MIKVDIALELQKVLPDLSKDQAIHVVDLLTSRMNEALLAGHRIELRGFGVFELRPRKAGYGRNIKNGQAVPIPIGRSIRFKPGLGMRGLASPAAPGTSQD